MFAIFKREIFTYFTSAIGYVFIAICFAVASFGFKSSLDSQTADLSLVFMLLVIAQFIFLPFLTMRLLSEEKRQKTDQLLLTSPVSLSGLVLGKFLSAFCVFLVGISISIIFAISLEITSTLNWTSTMGSFLGLTLIGGVFISIGIFVSSFTESQMIAAIISFFINAILFLISIIKYFLPNIPEFLQVFLNNISIYERFSKIATGIMDISTLVYFISMIFIFLFFTVRVLDARRFS